MNHCNGTYVALELSDDGREKINTFSRGVLELGSPVDPDYLHTTVIYSTAPVPAAEFLKSDIIATARPLRYEIFGSKPGLKCLTIILEFDVATTLNTMLTSVGATSKFGAYTPHLTLSYNYNGPTSKLPIPQFELIYDRLVVKPLDIDFIPPTSKDKV